MRRLLPLVVALVVLGGCGGQETRFSSTPPSARADAVSGTVAADVLAISEPAPGRFRMTLRTVGSAEGCVSKVKVRPAFDDASGRRLEAVYDTTGAADCRGAASLVVRRKVSGMPRTLVVNDESWRPGPGRTWVRCDAALGCDPPPDRCAAPWINELVARSDLPPERRIGVISCGGGRLQLDVDADITGCQTPDGVEPPLRCKGTGVHEHWLATLDSAQRWRVVSSVAK